MYEERTRFQNIVLVILAAMAVLFGILTAVSRARTGAYFEGSILRAREYEDRTVYRGKAYGTPVEITVTRTDEKRIAVKFHIEGVLDDTCVVEYPLDPFRTEIGRMVNGVRITQNGKLLFQGGYGPETSSQRPMWFDSEGNFDTSEFITIRGVTSDPWHDFSVDKVTAMRFALGPEPMARGNWGLYFMMLVLTSFVALIVAFPMSAFYLKHCCDVRDPEPSDFYLACQRAGWVLFPMLLFAGYCYALWMLP